MRAGTIRAPRPPTRSHFVSVRLHATAKPVEVRVMAYSQLGALTRFRRGHDYRCYYGWEVLGVR